MHSSPVQHGPIDELYRGLTADDGAAAVSVILKVRGETCDIDCLYCYEKRKEAPGGARIDAGQVRRLAEIFPGRRLAIELHGGEPLTAGREHIGEVLRELAAQPSVIRVSIQTNGVLLDDAWLDLFESAYPGLRIGVSLDGDAKGNAWRVGYDGAPVYPKVAAALRLLAARGWKAGAIAAVTPAVVGRAEEVLDHLAGFEAVNAVSFVPCFDTPVQRPTASSGRRLPASRLLQQAAVGAEDGPAWAISPSQYAEFVLAATARWITGGHFTRLKLEPAVSTIRRLRGLGTGFCHFSDLKCDHVFTLYPDGRLGSCDELPWPQAQITRLGQTAGEPAIVAAQRQLPLLNQGKGLMGRCSGCSYRSVCGGGCIATRWRYEKAGDQDAYCDYRMRMIDGIAALLAQPAHPDGAWCRAARWRPQTRTACGTSMSSSLSGTARTWTVRPCGYTPARTATSTPSVSPASTRPMTSTRATRSGTRRSRPVSARWSTPSPARGAASRTTAARATRTTASACSRPSAGSGSCRATARSTPAWPPPCAVRPPPRPPPCPLPFK
ncbi:radical SAM protein [Streptomyces sp. NPDC094447]|uniref:radical SAM protein n=1 Tax=Streptomyces sp. NPDC094447 TaxID=3366062 RepID=UPI00382E4993